MRQVVQSLYFDAMDASSKNQPISGCGLQQDMTTLTKVSVGVKGHKFTAVFDIVLVAERF
jgi:hypothetical protein